MYEMNQRHPVWVAENHVKPCNSEGTGRRNPVSLIGEKEFGPIMGHQVLEENPKTYSMEVANVNC
jgi:hypothetical protein